MQMMGDTFKPSPEKISTSSGEASLYHSLLFYKNRACEYIVSSPKLKSPNSLVKVGFYNEYPCIMVWINPKSIFKSEKTKWPSVAAEEAWVNFVMSYFLGLLNFNAYKLGIPIETQRRSSFGFITPTIAPTSGSFRINMGIIPNIYADIIVESLRQLDEVLKNLPHLNMPIPQNTFYGSEAHKKYLTEVVAKKVEEEAEVETGTEENTNTATAKKAKVKKIYTPLKLDSLIDLLWAQIEKCGKTTVQNVVRTAYARDGIALEVENQLAKNKTHLEAFANGLQWAIDKIYIKKQGARTSVSVKTEEKLDSIIKFSKLDCKITDIPFWKMINELIHHFSELKIPKLQSTLEKLKQCSQTKILNEVYLHLEVLNQLVFVSGLENAKNTKKGDGYGSDSDTEEEVNKVKVFSKKIITHSGMRAIWASILTISHYYKKNNSKYRLFLDNTYYEVPLGLKIINKLHKDSSIETVTNISEANTILYDINACVTNGKPNIPLDPKSIDNKILILDATSATSQQINPYLLSFAQSRATVLFVVDSGFKNQQAGADLNQYGTVRIFTRGNIGKKMLEELYAKIKTIEPPLLSPTSHALRRIYKAADLVPVTRRLFNP